jgi:hypothetical protein
MHLVLWGGEGPSGGGGDTTEETKEENTKKFSLSIPLQHIGDTEIIAPFILNVSTRPR